MGPTNELEWYTADEVAARMRVHRNTVYRLVENKDLPANRFGRSIRIPVAAVEEYILDSSNLG